MIIRDVRLEDIDEILGIFSDAIINTTAVWNDAPTTWDERRAWPSSKKQAEFPVLVAVREERVLGFGSYGAFRPWVGYRHSIEHSVFVDPRCHRQSIAHGLMRELIGRAQATGYHAMIAGIDAANSASIGLHEALGFAEVGYLPQVGRKFDLWLDLVFMQLLFPEAA